MLITWVNHYQSELVPELLLHLVLFIFKVLVQMHWLSRVFPIRDPRAPNWIPELDLLLAVIT